LTQFLLCIGFANVRARFWGGGGRWWAPAVYRVAPQLRYNMVITAMK
jgi:hypothetical protein